MKLIVTSILLSSILFSIQGIIVFNDQTIIEGDVKTIDNNSVIITPKGLTFPEEILLQSIDSVKINNGMIPIVNGKIFYFYQNGKFVDAQQKIILSKLMLQLTMKMLNMFLCQTGA